MIVTFKLDFLSKYRTELMGMAIFWIFFYHTGVNIFGLNALFSVGWIGVEIFFLLSGFGLCASLANNNDVLQFYKRRLIRIIPTWWLILGIMHFVGLALGGVKCPHSIWESIQWYTGIGWWIGGMCFEWYMPTLVLFYTMAPFVNKLSTKCLVVCVALSVMIGIGLHAVGVLDHVYMSYQRVPVFLMGFIMYRKYNEGGLKINVFLWLISIFLGIVVFGYAYTFKNSDVILSLEIRRYALLLFLLPLMRVMTFLFGDTSFMTNKLSDLISIRRMFLFCGTISMEIYLLHINHEYSSMITDMLEVYMNGYFVNIIWFLMVVIAALVIHLFVKSVQRVIL